MTQFESADDLLQCLNYPLLQKQKMQLLSIREEVLTEAQIDTITAIVNVIDAIQDIAVDRLGFNGKIVFNIPTIEGDVND